MAGVRDWAVATLRDLHFEGDADALAAYVDALAENNAEHENGDLSTLKEEASSELADFLGPDGAKSFVANLVTHLAKTRGISLGADPPTPPAPPAPSTAAPQQAVVPAPSAVRERPRSDRERERASRSRGRDRDRERDRDRDREREKERGRDRDRVRDDRASARGSRAREAERPSVMERLAPDTRNRERNPIPRRSAPAPVDLREQLSRRRSASGMGSSPPGPQKRPRDEGIRMAAPQKLARFDKGRMPHPLSSGLPGVSGVPGAPGVQGVPSVSNVSGVPPPPPGAPPGFPFAMLPPQMMMAMSNAAAAGRPGAPPPDPALLAQILAATANAAAAVRGRGSGVQSSRGRGGRGGRGGRPDRGDRNGSTNGGSSARGSSSTLIVRNIPEDKLNFIDLNNYFQRFGALSNIRLLPPGRALLEFANKSQAQAAMSSVDAVFNNRHVKLNWARDQDTSESATGGRNSSRHSKSSGQSFGREGVDSNGVASAPVPMEDPEAELKRKRQEILMARKVEEREKEAKKTAQEAALAERAQLFKTLEDGNLSLVDKKMILKRMQAISHVLTDDTTTSKPAARPAPVAEAQAQEKPWKRQRVFPKHKSYTLDNRPKVVRIMGAKDGISPDAAAAIFRDTERAETDAGAWILHFSTRAAAESALRAVFVLKRGFGPAAKAEIIKFSPTAQPFVPASDATPASPPGPGTTASVPVVHPQSLPGTQ